MLTKMLTASKRCQRANMHVPRWMQRALSNVPAPRSVTSAAKGCQATPFSRHNCTSSFERVPLREVKQQFARSARWHAHATAAAAPAPATEQTAAARRAAAKAAEQEEQRHRIRQSGVRVIVECCFSSKLAAGREVKSLLRQLQNADVVNRKHQRPCRLAVSSFGASMETAASELRADAWWMDKCARPAHELIGDEDPTKVIVLSPDAQLELEEVVEGHTYIIGGLVDRTVHKNQTLFYAADHGYQARRLPLEESLTFTGEGSKNAKWKVLNIDAVVMALLEARRTGSWMVALEAAVPARKRRLSLKRPPRARVVNAPAPGQ